jgi:hypothetical protein
MTFMQSQFSQSIIVNSAIHRAQYEVYTAWCNLFPIQTIVKLCFSPFLGRFFSLKLFHSQVFGAKITAGGCISQRAVAFQH